MANVQNYIGLAESEAVEEIKKDGFRPRIVQKDDKHFMGTMDFRTDRINLVIKEGKVESATIG